jgi:hypothetical protein
MIGDAHILSLYVPFRWCGLLFHASGPLFPIILCGVSYVVDGKLRVYQFVGTSSEG